MQDIVAGVSDIVLDIEYQLKHQIGCQPLPFPGMDKSSAAVCEFFVNNTCNRGAYCPFRHTAGEKTVVCKHWLRGLCKKGDQCEFLHQYDMTKMPECYFYSKFGECSNKECQYLHIDPMSKIKDCPWYDRGFCKHGPHCRHRHVRRVICINYLCGFCPEGASCKHKHPRFELPIVKDENIEKKFNITCHSCGQSGHKASSCPQNPQKENFKPNTINIPTQMGDQQIFGRRPLETVTCFKCGDKGHYANKVGQIVFLRGFTEAASGDTSPCGVPDSLRATYINVASSAAGAVCKASGGECLKAIDGKSAPSDASWHHNGGIGHWIKITFKKTFLIDTLRIQQRSFINSQYKEIKLEFSSGEFRKVTLTRNRESGFLKEALWDVFHFVIVRAKWVNIKVNSVYSSLNNGLREVELYKRDALKGKICESLKLLRDAKSRPQKLFSKSISMVVKGSKQHISLLDDTKKYIFNLKQDVLALRKYDGSSTVTMKSVPSNGLLSADSFTPLWIDIRCSTITLGTGNEVILQWKDPTPLNVDTIVFGCGDTDSCEVTLCNRQDRCFNDAAHFWPFDRVTAGKILDYNGDKTFPTNLSNSEFIKTQSASSLFTLEPQINLVQTGDIVMGDFSGEAINDPNRGDFTLSFWFKVISISSSFWTHLIYSSTSISARFRVYVTTDSVLRINVRSQFGSHSTWTKVTTGRSYHVALIWNQKKDLLIATLNGYPQKVAFSSGKYVTPSDAFIKISFRKSGKFTISNIVLWKKVLSIEELQNKLACTGVRKPESSCTVAVKVTCGNSYTEDNCLSVGCCYAGGVCYYADGQLSGSAKETIPTLAKSSSDLVPWRSADNGRMIYGNATGLTSGWRPKQYDTTSYLQLDAFQITKIGHIVVQGSGNDYVKEFLVSFSKSCVIFTYVKEGNSRKIFSGNGDGSSMKTVDLPSTIEASCVRIEPTSFVGNICLRAKLLGTIGPTNRKGCYQTISVTPADGYDTNFLTPSKCISFCARASKGFAALTSGRYCYCAASLSGATSTTINQCNFPCSGNPRLTCGGKNVYEVFTVSGSSDPTFNCSFPSSAKRFAALSVQCSPHSVAVCDFGEGMPVVESKGSHMTYNYSSSYDDFHVTCTGAIEAGDVGKYVTYNGQIMVDDDDDYKAEITCPGFIPQTSANCLLKVNEGKNLKLKYQLKGQTAVTSIDLSDTVGIVYGNVFEESEETTDQSQGTTIITSVNAAPDDGALLGIDLIIETTGCASIQIIRPICGSGPESTYTYTNGYIEKLDTKCSALQPNCTSEELFSFDAGQCIGNGIISENPSSLIPDKFEVISSSPVCFTSSGRKRFYLNKILYFQLGDLFALNFPDSSALKISSRKASGEIFTKRPSVFVITQSNAGPGSILAKSKGIFTYSKEFSIGFLTKITSTMSIPLVYSSVGEYEETFTIEKNSKRTDFKRTVVVQQNVEFGWGIKGAIYNETFPVTVTAFKGNALTAVITFGSTAPQSVALTKTHTFQHTFTVKGKERITVTVYNNVSLAFKECLIAVQEKVQGLVFNVPLLPVTYPNSAQICIKLTGGDNVYIRIYFGDGRSNYRRSIYVKDKYIVCFTHSYNVGVFKVYIKAQNSASLEELNHYLYVEKEIKGMKCTFSQEHSHHHIELNENVCFDCSLTQGTNPTFKVDWKDGTLKSFVKQSTIRACHKYKEYNFFDINITVSNHVSSMNFSKEIQVHKPVYRLTNFKIVCPPTNVTKTTSCTHTTGGGNDFNCTWDFGDGKTAVSNDSNVGHPFLHLYNLIGYYTLVVKCANRLYSASVTVSPVIVEIPMLGLHIGDFPNCPLGSKITSYVAVKSGSGVHFTLKKTNLFTRKTEVITPMFNKQKTNGSFTFSCDVVGAFALEATSNNNVSKLQSLTKKFNVDQPIDGLTLTRKTEEYVYVNALSVLYVKTVRGTNITLYWNFDDGSTKTFRVEGVFPPTGFQVSHAYKDSIDAVVRLIANNSVSQVSLSTRIMAQFPHRLVTLVCSDPQNFPPGKVQCTIDKPSSVHFPTNSTCILNWGDGNDSSSDFNKALVFKHVYNSPGWYDIDAMCSNNIDNVTLVTYVQVENPIDKNDISLTTEGGIYGKKGHGKGHDKSYFPSNQTITVQVDWGVGFNVTLFCDWGDSSPRFETKKSSCYHNYTTPGLYQAVISFSNALSKFSKAYPINIQNKVTEFEFINDGPVALGKTLTFHILFKQIGSRTCFSLDIGNGISYLYKPDTSVTCEPECSYGKIPRVYGTFPLAITQIYKHIANYKINACACNKVSRIVVNSSANVSPKPCKYPIVKFISYEANTTVAYAIQYPKSLDVPIAPMITIDCEATKYSRRVWGIQKCDEDGNPDSCKDLTSNCSKKIVMTNPVLKIPYRCLEYGIHRLSAEVEMLGGGTVGIAVTTYGFINITRTALLAYIAGGSSKAVGYNTYVLIDGTKSIDPDTGNNHGLKYFWFCHKKSEKFDINQNSSSLPPLPTDLKPDLRMALVNINVSIVPYSGCFGYGPGKLHLTSGKINISTAGMMVNESYVVTLLVFKDFRWASATLELEIVKGSPPQCTIVCIVGCGKKCNPSDKHSLKVACGVDRLKYQWRIFKQNQTTNELEEVQNPERFVTLSLNFNNIVVRPNSLEGGSVYVFKIEAWDKVNGVMGYSSRRVLTNASPRNGLCEVFPSVGDSETNFNISCPYWVDDNEFLIISIFYYEWKTDRIIPIASFRSDASIWLLTTLRVGNKTRGYNNTIMCQICDPLLSCTSVQLEVTVTLRETKELELRQHLLSVLSVDGQIPTLMGEGRINELCAYIFKEVSNIHLILETAHFSNYTTSLIVKFAEFSMNSTLQIVSSDPKKASCKSSVINLILKLKVPITEYTKSSSLDGLMEAAKDLSSLPISDLTATVGGLVDALGTSLSSTAVGPTAKSLSPEDAEKKNEANMKQSENYLGMFGNIGDTLINNQVPGEVNVVVTPEITMQVSKLSARDAKRFSLPGGGGIDGLSNALGSFPDEDIGIKALDMPKSLYSWAPGADVTSNLMDFTASREDSNEISINNLDEPFAIEFAQLNETMLAPYELNRGETKTHIFKVPKNHSAIFVELVPLDCNATYLLLLKKNGHPSKSEHDFNRTVNYTSINTTESNGCNLIWLLSNEDLNNTAAGTWRLSIEFLYELFSEPDFPINLGYNMSISTPSCVYFDKSTKSFSSKGMKVGPKTTRFVTQCLTSHSTTFASDFFVPPNSIDFSKINLDELMKNPIVFIVVMVIFGLYFLLLIWARRADKKDLDKIGLTPLPDNDPRDTYLYEIVVYTGHTSGAGTTSNVYIILSGGLDETTPKKLCDLDPARKKFCKGNVDYFLLAVPRSLGRIRQLRIWHTNEGSDPSWFLQRIMVRDLQADTKTWFVNLRWLAVEEDDGMIERTLYPASKEELTNFGLLFSTEARKNLTDNHLWFSVVARPPKSTFTRVQRLSCCLSVILTTMLANAMFYEVGTTSSAGTAIHVGPFSFSIRQISIGITSSLVVLPVNVIVVTIFRKIKPLDPKTKDKDSSEKYRIEETPEVLINDGDVSYATLEEEIDEDHEKEEEEEQKEDEKKKKKEKKKKDKPKKKPMTLSPKFAYLAYTMIFIASTVSATFTVFYGLTFGKEKSEGWISSMMISFWQDVLISQPLKVFAAAMFFALVIKDPNKNDDENEQNELNHDEELVHKNVQNSEEEQTLRKLGFVAKPPDPVKLENIRQLKLKQKQMKAILYEIVQYLFFLVLVLVIAYGNRDPMAYGVTRAMRGYFVESQYTAMDSFENNDRPSTFWSWVLESYLPTLKPKYWYGPWEKIDQSEVEYNDNMEVFYMKERFNGTRWITSRGNYVKKPTVLHRYPQGFVADHATAFLVGSPRIRQLRIKRNQSKSLPLLEKMFGETNPDYDWDVEDTQSYNPKWEPFEENQTREEESDSPWYYRSAWELKGTPYWGFFSSYWGGGYVVDFGSDRTKAEAITAQLSRSGWIDKYSRALFAEFTVYNPYTNFFSAVTLLTEIRATGGYFHSPKVQTLRLYRYIGPEMAFVMACEISYIAFLLYFLFKQVKKYRTERSLYFKDGWNYLEITVLSFSISSVGLYFARMGMTTYTIKNMNDNLDTFVSFQYVAFLDEWVSATCSMAVFFSFLKFLRLLRFNRRMALLSLTLKKAAGPLFYFFVYFAIIFLAYVQFGFSIFGVSDLNYASFHRSIVSVFSMTLGDFDFDSLCQSNRIFGPMFFFSYVFLVIFILMNVFLGILVDTFNEVNRDVLQQGNDHEMLAFMVHSVKSNIGRKCGPAIKPTYIEEKTVLEKAVDDIDVISDNIEYAFRNICQEDIRQEKWFDLKKTNRKKSLVVQMLTEDEENMTENDLCDAIPVLDEFIANHSLHEIVRFLVTYREKRRLDEMADEDNESESSSDSESDATASSDDGRDENDDNSDLNSERN